MTSTYVASNANAYESSMGRWSRQLARPFVEFAGLESATRVLDVGCGTGALVAALPATATAIGIDIGEAFLRAARTSIPRASFACADAGRLPLADASVDAATSLLVLNFLPDPDAAITEMRRVTRAGGVAAACVWDFRGGLVFMRVFADTAAALFASGESFRQRHYASPLGESGGLAEAFRRRGLHAIAETSLTIRMAFAGFDDLWDPWLAGQGIIGAYVAALPEADRTRLGEAMRRAYLAGGTDGPRSFAATAWAVRARV